MDLQGDGKILTDNIFLVLHIAEVLLTQDVARPQISLAIAAPPQRSSVIRAARTDRLGQLSRRSSRSDLGRNILC